MGAYKCLLQTEFGSARLRDQNFTGRKLTKTLTSLNRYFSVIFDIEEKWFVIFEHTINHLSFGYVCLPQLENYFSWFAFFSYFFFLFLLPLSIFKPLNAQYSKFERLKILGRTSVGLKSVVPDEGIPLNRVLQNFELLNRYS